MIYVLMTLLMLTAIFLIVIVLIQRGKGGGLAGALGGMGGQSAFGTKAGDLFTRITIGVAAFWIVLCMITVKYFGTSTSRLDVGAGGPGSEATAPANTEGVPAPSDKPLSAPAEKPAAPSDAPAKSSK